MRIFLSVLFTMLFCSLFSQDALQREKEIQKIRQLFQSNPDIKNYGNLKLKSFLEGNGISENTVELLLNNQNQHEGKNTTSSSIVKVNPKVNVACSDLGGDNGWSSWSAQTGIINDNFTTGAVTITWTASTTTAPRFNLTSGTGNDACTPGGGGPAVTNVCQGFGNASIELGELQTAGGYAEQISIPFNVTAADQNFIYAYAVVLENAIGHTYAEEPYAAIYMVDSIGDTIPASYRRYSGDPGGSIPIGMYAGSATCFTDVAYQPWSFAGVNLTNYVGHTITIHVINSDCAQGGHFCQSYWDFSCGAILYPQMCIGKPSTITGPAPNPGIHYSYQWYHHGAIMTGDTLQNISLAPAANDTFSLHVTPASGGSFWLTYVTPSNAFQSLFTYSLNVDTVRFTNLATGSTGVYTWNFGDGSTSTAVNPVHVYLANGTFIASLIATNGICQDTAYKVIIITANGIEELGLRHVYIYPNPASENLFLDFGNQDLGEAEISFSDVLGRTLERKIISAQGRQTLDVSGLEQGIYFLKLKTSSGEATSKLVIAH
ncbi:MAG TPA: T9SS type A sorting domain-containing protein [Bacteroidia bacterium]